MYRSADLETAYPGARIGMLLVENVDNTPRPTALDARKAAVETHLREKYAGWERAELLALDVLSAYRAYYKKFGNTYHVQLQLESILYKGKSLPRVSPLVDAGFLAEIETLVLTAAHDADRLVPPLGINISTGSEEFTQMSGTSRTLKPNDMMMTDSARRDLHHPVRAGQPLADHTCHPAGTLRGLRAARN